MMAAFISDGESRLVDSLVMIRFNTPNFSSSEKLLVENFLNRRLTISSLESLLGSIIHQVYRAKIYTQSTSPIAAS